MPHQCVRCGTFYGDASKEILEGCNCGAKLFFYVKKSKFEKLKSKSEQITKDLTQEEKVKIEEEVYEIIGDDARTAPVVLDLETINVPEQGKFEIDLVQLFNKENPIVYKLEEGKYMIDIPETFRRSTGVDSKKSN
jgi:hypothetical protein